MYTNSILFLKWTFDVLDPSLGSFYDIYIFIYKILVRQAMALIVIEKYCYYQVLKKTTLSGV